MEVDLGMEALIALQKRLSMLSAKCSVISERVILRYWNWLFESLQ